MTLLLALACTAKTPDDSGGPAALADAYTLSDEGLFPEGVAFHEGERAFFMGSLEGGAITRLDADGAETVIFEPDPGWMSLGMKIAPGTDTLVVCAIQGYGTEDVHAALWRFDVTTGARTSEVDLGAGSNCNDVAIDAAGTTWVTDRESPNLYRVPAGGAAELWATDEALGSTLIGLNGAVLTDTHLLVGIYAPATVLRVALADPTDIQEVAVTGDDLGSLPDGLDGITWFGDTMVIAGNSRVLELRSDDGWASATCTATEQEVAFAAVTVAEGRVYGLKGEIVPYVLGMDVDLPFELRVAALSE
ncbi:MAG: SMP-30/gluconolactonase/LRE family protein [Alphaproteobacteria bacterium]|nr:SMP-30/gluconolactonase/LRE family protein [Alphaproteobacteria bacterium]